MQGFIPFNVRIDNLCKNSSFSGRRFSHTFIFLFTFIFYLVLGNTISSVAWAQFDADGGDEDLNIGGDIFSDFNEELEATQVLEDERFYRYGRFYSFNINSGMTTFTGNRGVAYEDKHPTLGLAVVYFLNFRVAFSLGFELSKHYLVINDRVIGFNLEGGPGLIEVNMFRTFFAYRYYLDTFDLGTAITYSNPYLTGRLEYWNQTNKFIDQPTIPNDSNGAVGAAIGIGFEFPLELKESYINVELLLHSVNFKDTYTQLYRPVQGSTGGYDDLRGNVITVMAGYAISW